MREEKNVRIKNDGSQIFRLPVIKCIWMDFCDFFRKCDVSVMSGISAAYVCRENVAG